jgi:hypothetical protein
MARGSTTRGASGTSRFRFVMFEGDLQEGELAQVTQAIQNAFRSPQIAAPRQVPRVAALSSAESDLDDSEPIDQVEDVVSNSEILPRQRLPRKASAPRVPNPVNDLDVKSDPSLKQFCSDYELKSGFDKYLVIALWLREARQINVFSVDHIYTCYKLLGWSTNSNDFGKPLRNLANNKFLSGDSKGYTLSLTGAGKIEDKKRPSND